MDPQSAFYRAVERAQAGLASVAAADLMGAVRVAFDTADAVGAGSPDAPHRACRPGCSHCCHFPVGVTIAEVCALAEHLEALPAAARQRIDARVAAEDAATSRSAWSDLSARLLPCPLLDEGRCTVHAARPLSCRGWNSLREADCARALQLGQQRRPMPPLPVDVPARVAAAGAAAALQAWLEAGDLPADTRELRSALAAVRRAGADGAARIAAFRRARRPGGEDGHNPSPGAAE